MKRLLLVAAAALAASATTPAAHAALLSTNVVGGGSTNDASAAAVTTGQSTLNPILNKIPGLGGPDRRYICVISDPIDKSWCFYVAIP